MTDDPNVTTPTPTPAPQPSQGGDSQPATGGEATIKNELGALAEMNQRYIEAQNKLTEEKWQNQQRIKELERALSEKEQQTFKDPYEAFSKLGGNFDELAERMINEGEPSQKHQLAEIMRKLDEQEQWRKQREESERNRTIESQRQQYVAEVAGDMLRTIRSDDYASSDMAQALDFFAEMGGFDAQKFLASKIEPMLTDYYQRTGRQLTPTELVGTLQKETEGFLDKLRNSKVLQRLYGASQEQQAADNTPDLAKIFGDKPAKNPEPPKPLGQTAGDNQQPSLDQLSTSRFYQYVDRLKNS